MLPLSGGRAALDEFSPSEQAILLSEANFCAGPQLISDASSLYESLRLAPEIVEIFRQDSDCSILGRRYRHARRAEWRVLR